MLIFFFHNNIQAKMMYDLFARHYLNHTIDQKYQIIDISKHGTDNSMTLMERGLKY